MTGAATLFKMSGPETLSPSALIPDQPHSRLLLVTILGSIAVVGFLLILGLVVIPVHVSPANGSIRCGNPPDIGVFHLDPAFRQDGTYDICKTGETVRRNEALLMLVGGIVGVLGLSLAILARRGGRTVGVIVGILGAAVTFGSFLAALGNTFLWD
jgi:hypothetical protein